MQGENEITDLVSKVFIFTHYYYYSKYIASHPLKAQWSGGPALVMPIAAG